MQFSTKQHKINYVRNYTKNIVYDIIKIWIRIDNDNFYLIIDEFLKNLNDNFDENDHMKQNKIYFKILDDKFRIIEIEKFEKFIIRNIVVIVDFKIIDEILIYQLKQKLFSILRYNII